MATRGKTDSRSKMIQSRLCICMLVTATICCLFVSNNKYGGSVDAWSSSMTSITSSSTSKPPSSRWSSSSSSRSSFSSSSRSTAKTRRMTSTGHQSSGSSRHVEDDHHKTDTTWLSSMVVAGAIFVASTTATITPMDVANAYVPSDYATETVQATIRDLNAASGNVEETFKVYENVAGIITEGKGVGGMVNYQGIQLERGYVADEDTTVYNPGLSLLTESEKERLVEAVIDARKVGLEKGQWSENNEFAFQFLRQKLDPYHMTELGGFLKVVPFYAAFLYVGVLAVQQLARGAFQVAYLVGAAAFFLPIVALIAAGP